MSFIQEIKETAELRGDEKRNVIIEQMNKLRKFQDENERREAEAKLQAEKEGREAKLQTEERLKMEEMRTQLEWQRYKHRQVSKMNTTLESGGTRPVREGESSKFKMPK